MLGVADGAGVVVVVVVCAAAAIRGLCTTDGWPLLVRAKPAAADAPTIPATSEATASGRHRPRRRRRPGRSCWSPRCPRSPRSPRSPRGSMAAHPGGMLAPVTVCAEPGWARLALVWAYAHAGSAALGPGSAVGAGSAVGPRSAVGPGTAATLGPGTAATVEYGTAATLGPGTAATVEYGTAATVGPGAAGTGEYGTAATVGSGSAVNARVSRSGSQPGSGCVAPASASTPAAVGRRPGSLARQRSISARTSAGTRSRFAGSCTAR